MRFKEGDSLLSMDVATPNSYVVTITDGGFGKRTSIDEWQPKGRGGTGVRAMKLPEERGHLVGAMVCSDTDQIFAIASNGVVIRTKVDEIRASGRDTMGVRMMRLGEDTSVVAVARGGEVDEDDQEDQMDQEGQVDQVIAVETEVPETEVSE